MDSIHSVPSPIVPPPAKLPFLLGPSVRRLINRLASRGGLIRHTLMAVLIVTGEKGAQNIEVPFVHPSVADLSVEMSFYHHSRVGQ